jgi:MYXO-CTERM domain-containing protein
MKMKTVSLLAGSSGSLLLASAAQAVITGVHVVPVSFEQGWVGENGAPYSSGTSTTAVSNDATAHARTQAAWAGSLGAYKTFRVYLTVDNLATPVNGGAGDDVAHINFTVESRLKDNSGTGSGFFNYATGAFDANGAPPPAIAASLLNAGPQAYLGATNNAQGQLAYDSYLTVGSASQGGDAGAAIEGAGTEFDAARGRSVPSAATIATGQVGNGGTGANGLAAASMISCENCGYLASTPITGVAYSYNSLASLAANFGLPITGQGVLIGQFTVKNTDGIIGQVLAVGTGTAATPQWTFSFGANVPAPGALALLGLAGIAARRRRR